MSLRPACLQTAEEAHAADGAQDAARLIRSVRLHVKTVGAAVLALLLGAAWARLVINLKTARALGLTSRASLLQRADQVT